MSTYDPIPPYAASTPGSVLGLGEDLRVLLVSRGGTGIITELKPTSGRFTRALDKVSILEMSGTVNGTYENPESSEWGQITPWVHEILVLRDGRDAWAGPVTDVQYDFGSVNVQADDLARWWDRRIIPKDLKYKDMDACQIFKGLHEAAMSVDPIPNFDLVIQSKGNKITREYLYVQSTYTQDAMAELSRTDVDWTAYGRNVIVSGQEIDADPRFIITDDMWYTPPRVHAKGNDQATYIMVNAKENILGIAIASQEYLDYYGRIDKIYDEAAIENQHDADLAASSRLAVMKDPLYIESPQGASLKPSAPISLAQLIPGMKIRIDSRATAKRVVGDFRLSGVDVNFNGKVQIDLQPVGVVDGLLE